MEQQILTGETPDPSRIPAGLPFPSALPAGRQSGEAERLGIEQAAAGVDVELVDPAPATSPPATLG